MNRSKSAEFAQFSFVRDAKGGVIELPSQAMDERIMLVVDRERWGLSRLHVFEGLASRREIVEAFEAEMQRLSRISGDSVSHVTAWGRDSEELFYADEVFDGEPLPDYLARTGRVPVATVSEWMLQLIEVLESVPEDIASIEHFSTQTLQVVVDRSGKVRPFFSEFHAWMKPGARVRERTREWYLAQVFCSLVGGIPVREFRCDSLPRNFDELEVRLKNVVLDALADGRPGSYEAFRSMMEELAAEGQIGEAKLELPLMPLRSWLKRDLAELETGIELPAMDYEQDPYAVSGEFRGSKGLLQILPESDSLPVKGWLNQHHDAIRRIGRVKLNQLRVNQITDVGSLTIIGEEQVDGASLAELVGGVGPLSLAETGKLCDRLSAVLTMLESQVGGGAVWWLPPENIVFVTGTRTRAAAGRFLERKGEGAWQAIPVKLRLHQTMSSLRRGVDLPARVKDLSCLPGKKFEATRRSAVALPLIWFVLTQRHFLWDLEVSQQLCRGDDIPEKILLHLEDYQNKLVENPTELDLDLFTCLQRELVAMDSNEAVGETDSKCEDDLEARLDSMLYKGEVKLREG